MNKQRDKHFTLRYLESLCGLSAVELSRAAAYLLELKYIQYMKIPELLGKTFKYYSDPPMELTERGANFRWTIFTEILKYIADKWTDIIACIIALISLIISIHTALSN